MEVTFNKAAGEKIDRRYEASMLRLEETIRNARLSNDRLSKQLFALTNRTLNVAERIGFASFDDFEEAVLDEPEVWKAETIKSNHARVKHEKLRSREKTCRSSSDGLRQELDQLKCQVQALHELSVRKPVNGVIRTTEHSPLSPLKSVGNSSPSESPTLREQFDVLSRKYDSLVAVKEEAERKYKEDYRKWRQFKSSLFNKSKHAKALRDQVPKEFDFGDGDEPQNGDDENHNAPRSKFHPIPLSNDENEAPAPSPKQVTASKGVTRQQSTRSLRMGQIGIGPPGSSHFRSRSASLSPTSKKRKNFHSDSSRPNVEEGSLFLVHHAPVQSLSVASKAQITKADTDKPINALYAIDTAKNNGLAFQYDEVVRNRNHRQRLEAGDCDCCKEYYDCLEPLPNRPALPWRSPPKEPTGQHQFQEPISSHKKQISRHRYQWSPAKTPPDYWNIGFPTTQEAAEINQRAAEIHADKRKRIEREANTSGGRYVRREDK